MRAYVYLENGLHFEANSYGAEGTFSAELVFNTSMSGYQEIISDPSYAGQFIVFSMPQIGIVGTNDEDDEAACAHCEGIIVRELSKNYSNYRARASLKAYLKKQGIIALSEVDTRHLVKLIRDEGNLKAIISTQIKSKEELKEKLLKSPNIEELKLVEKVSTNEAYTHEQGAWDHEKGAYESKLAFHKCVGVIDYGVKKNILNELASLGIASKVFPFDVKAASLIKLYKKGELHGIFLSNGPGEPKSLKKQIQEIKLLIKAKIPIFGICLGHQLLANAFGYETYKMKFGQHGSNHPVLRLADKSVEITSQNHNYNVPEEIEEIATITHRNLFGGNVEGLFYKAYPIISVQHHPESSAGPHESKYIFKDFLKML